MHIIKWVTNMNVHTHNVSIIDRNVVNITGVNKIESFDNEEFLLETVMGFIDIKGIGISENKNKAEFVDVFYDALNNQIIIKKI